MKNIMKSVELEMNLKQLDNEIKEYKTKVDIQLAVIDINYKGDRLRDMDLIKELTVTMDNLLIQANKIKDIEFQAIKINDYELYWKCEQKIAKVIETMEYIRTTYMF